MRLVVLDTNVIVSASINAVGPPAKIITDWGLSGMVHTVTSPFVVAEYRESIQRAKCLAYTFPLLWLECLMEDTIRVPDSDLWPCPGPDSQDTPFLAVA